MICRNIEMEARLIDDLLDLTRIARGKVQINLQPCRADELLNHALETVELSNLAARQIGQLSGGQQQRMFIARALAQEAELSKAIEQAPPELKPTLRDALAKTTAEYERALQALEQEQGK